MNNKKAFFKRLLVGASITIASVVSLMVIEKLLNLQSFGDYTYIFVALVIGGAIAYKN